MTGTRCRPGACRWTIRSTSFDGTRSIRSTRPLSAPTDNLTLKTWGRAQVGARPLSISPPYAAALRSVAARFVEGRRDLSIRVHGEMRGVVEDRSVAQPHRERERGVLVPFVQVEVTPNREPPGQGRLSRVKRHRADRTRLREGRPEFTTGQRVDMEHAVVRARDRR